MLIRINSNPVHFIPIRNGGKRTILLGNYSVRCDKCQTPSKCRLVGDGKEAVTTLPISSMSFSVDTRDNDSAGLTFCSFPTASNDQPPVVTPFHTCDSVTIDSESLGFSASIPPNVPTDEDNFNRADRTLGISESEQVLPRIVTDESEGLPIIEDKSESNMQRASSAPTGFGSGDVDDPTSNLVGITESNFIEPTSISSELLNQKYMTSLMTDLSKGIQRLNDDLFVIKFNFLMKSPRSGPACPLTEVNKKLYSTSELSEEAYEMLLAVPREI